MTDDPMTDLAAPDRTLPHNLEAERSVLGAILLHNEAFNQAAEVIDAGDFFRDAHRRIFEKMVLLSERRHGDRHRHAEGGTGQDRRDRRSGRAGLHRLAGGRRPAVDQRRVLRAHHQGEGDPPQPDLRGQPHSHHRVRPPRRKPTTSSTAPSRRSSPSPNGGSATASCRSARWRTRASRRSSRLYAREAAHHRSPHRVQRPRRVDVGPAARRPGHRRGAALDGEDEPRAEHRAARRARERT